MDGRGFQVVGVRKHFGGVQALRDVSLTFQPGRVHAVLGANGAGKSTMIGIASGALVPDAGTLKWDGETLSFPDPGAARSAGIAVVHQEPAAMPKLTVTQNLAVADLAKAGALRLLSMKRLRQEASVKLDRLGVTLPLDAPVESLTITGRQLIEIASALASSPRVLFLDEPNSALAAHESDRLLSVVRAMAAAGTAVVLVSHRLREVFEVAQDLSILRDGEVVWTGPASSIDIGTTVDLMAGRAVQQLHRAHDDVARRRVDFRGDVVLAARKLARPGEFEAIDIEVRAGEVLGVTGLIGSGRTELVSTVVGQRRPVSGSLEWIGKEVAWGGPADAWRSGIAYVPEDRKTEGLFPSMSVRWNIESTCRTLGLRPARDTTEIAELLQIKMSSLEAPVSSLSGGNQQKVVIGRALQTGPKLLVLDEPTRGIDVAAKADIYALVRELANDGCAVLVVSSEFDEVSELCDRIVVMRTGHKVAEFAGGTDQATLLAASFGQAA
jgi:ABC-type sugar transport system ATPase subunit